MTSLISVADGVLVATHPFCATTTTLVLAEGNGCLVIDPGITADEIDAVAAEITAMGRRVTAGFSTHPHWDHMLWRDSLGDAPRYATAIGARTAVEQIADNVQHAQSSVPGVDATPLDRVVPLEPGASMIPWDGPRVRVLEHRAHAPGHAALLIEEARVLVAGDMLSDVEIPLPDRLADDPLGDYEHALDLFTSFADAGQVDVVIPGHGSVGDQRELLRRIEADRAYLAGVRSGGPVDDARLAGADEWLQREHAAHRVLAAR